jgi:cytochrome c-type biogenesis protein CcsB
MTTRAHSGIGVGLVAAVRAAAAILLLLATATARAEGPSDPFAAAVNLIRLGQVAVHHEGRIKSFDSFASGQMHMVSGPHRIDGQSHAFTYLDMVFRWQAYEDRPVIYVKNRAMRARMIDTLRGAPEGAEPGFEEAAALLRQKGLISKRLLASPALLPVLSEMSRDLVRTARFVDMLEGAMGVSRPLNLLDAWRVVPPADGSDVPWLGMLDVMSDDPAVDLHGLDQATRQRLGQVWRELVSGWVEEDAARVNRAADQLAAILPSVNPAIYPVPNRLAWESWYFHARNLTWVWLIYALALVPLLAHLVFRWRAARWMGMGLFLLAFGLQTFALVLRWYVAQRWPNSNMFEAVTTSAWFGGCAALVLEVLVRRTRMRGLFALASGAASMVAFMCAHFQPMYLDPNVANRMPVLHDVWLYIHTNVIILSYCLIFMAAVSGLLYLLYRAAGRVAGFGGSGDFARVGGAGSLIVGGADGGAAVAAAPRTSLGQVLDGTTMILMELSFVLLWAGLVMGAIWADHAWGRPWGWDPKEVFALNTFLVFAVLVHGRLKVRDKGLWTAVVALIGAGVMLFNWIAINFVITGLHSYA